jgi:transposase-like protein
VVGVVSRETGEIHLGVAERTDQASLRAFVNTRVEKGATVYSDSWSGYAGLAEDGHPHATVNHGSARREWARDDDGDGIREVHDNTLEGLWAALRTFLRPFRGVSKHYLYQYIAIFQWAYNLKQATPAALRAMFGFTPGAT